MIIAHVKQSLRETFHARASEWALATMTFLWAIVLFDNHTIFATNPAFERMAALVSQPVVAFLCLIVGGARLCVLAVNGAWRRSPHARAFMSFISSLFWFQVSIGLLASDQLSTGLAVYPVLFFLDTFNVVRSMGEAGSADRQHKRAAQDGSDL